MGTPDALSYSRGGHGAGPEILPEVGNIKCDSLRAKCPP